MNERIKELVKQAGGHFSTHNLMSKPVQYRESIELWDDNIEKFAELLVKEVTNIVLHYTNVDEGVAVAKKHFGVEVIGSNENTFDCIIDPGPASSKEIQDARNDCLDGTL